MINKLPNNCPLHSVYVHGTGEFKCMHCKKYLSETEARNILIEIFGEKSGELSLKILKIHRKLMKDKNQLNLKAVREMETLRKEAFKD